MTTETSAAVTVSIVIPVYRDAGRAIALVQSLTQQRPASGPILEIIVVDDGSADGTFESVSAAVGKVARVVRLLKNSGRSAARNAGADHATSERILFMDCDCLPGCTGLIDLHLQQCDETVVATIGPVMGSGEGFWHRYQAEASERRRQKHNDGVTYSGSSQNLMVLREAFNECGRFDTAYRGYGFEDRDLQIRISKHGKIRWCDSARVNHMDALSMVGVSKKLAEAAGHSAALFRNRHPDAYQRLGYASLDAHLHPWLRTPSLVAALLVPGLAQLVDRLLPMPWLPYSFKALIVRGVSATSYLAGCRPR